MFTLSSSTIVCTYERRNLNLASDEWKEEMSSLLGQGHWRTIYVTRSITASLRK